MTSVAEKNIAVVKKAYEALTNNLGMDVFLSHFAPDAEIHEAPSLPYGGVYKGMEMLPTGMAAIFTAFEDFRFNILNFLTGDDLVVVHLMLTGRGKKTGKTFSMPLMEMWRIRDGKVIEVRPFYFDTARVIECFGG